jgi:glycosyltransferase involved in cell wall biosynthesis
LNVGTIEPRKNQMHLVESYARYLALDGAPMPLVLAGGKGWLMDDFKKHLDALGISAHVVLTGYVSDEELIWLYRNCYANLYPSLFEGFGLPVLEGMQFGAPTVTSNSTSIPEVAAGAAILLPPEDVDGWAQTMVRLATAQEERKLLGDAARARAALFEWKRSAAQLLQLYEDAMAAPKRGGAL